MTEGSQETSFGLLLRLDWPLLSLCTHHMINADHLGLNARSPVG